MVDGSDGLRVAAQFYEEGGVDTRRRVVLHDVNFGCVVEGDAEAVRAMAERFAMQLSEEAGVSQIIYAVSDR